MAKYRLIPSGGIVDVEYTGQRLVPNAGIVEGSGGGVPPDPFDPILMLGGTLINKVYLGATSLPSIQLGSTKFTF